MTTTGACTASTRPNIRSTTTPINNVIDDHLAAFQYARDKGIPYTAYARETRGPDNVWDTVQHFAPARLGHGVPCLEHPALFEHLQQYQIHLEVCPTSNIQTNTFDTYADHPIDKLYRAGISVGVNTDTRTLSNITLSEELERALDVRSLGG